MRRSKKNIKEEVELTLRSLDNVERVESNPFFYTKLQQRIENEKSLEKTSSFSWNKLWQPALVIALIAVNTFTFYSLSTSSDTTDDGVSLLMNEYNIQASSNEYDYLN